MNDFKTLLYKGNNFNLKTRKYLKTGNLAVEVYEYFKVPYATLTVNTPWVLRENEAFVDINNWPDAEDFIITFGLGKFTGLAGTFGPYMCEYPLYDFDLGKLKEY